MSKVLEGMARAYLSHFGTVEPQAADKLAMGFALLWLADNVTDEMAGAWHTANFRDGWSYKEMCEKVPGYADEIKESIAAALRQAAGGGDKNDPDPYFSGTRS